MLGHARLCRSVGQRLQGGTISSLKLLWHMMLSFHPDRQSELGVHAMHIPRSIRSTEPVMESAAELSRKAWAFAASSSVQRRRP